MVEQLKMKLQESGLVHIDGRYLPRLYFNEVNSWNILFIYFCSDQFTVVSAENDNLQEEHDRLQQRHSKLLHDMTEEGKYMEREVNDRSNSFLMLTVRKAANVSCYSSSRRYRIKGNQGKFKIQEIKLTPFECNLK